jgi:hypothetical protein
MAILPGGRVNVATASQPRNKSNKIGTRTSQHQPNPPASRLQKLFRALPDLAQCFLGLLLGVLQRRVGGEAGELPLLLLADCWTG